MPHDPEAVLTLPPQPRSAAQARRFVGRTLSAWQAAEVREVAELLVSELVTNAIRHAATPVRVRLRMERSGLRVEVADGSAGRPRPRLPELDSESGRGLYLVDQLARDWGVRQERGGKAVWFQLDLLSQAVPAG